MNPRVSPRDALADTLIRAGVWCTWCIDSRHRDQPDCPECVETAEGIADEVIKAGWVPTFPTLVEAVPGD